MFFAQLLYQLLFAHSFPCSLSVNEKRVIVLSIHQPRYSIFKLFDSLTLLSQGSTVYHGPAHLALAYFDKLGEGY